MTRKEFFGHLIMKVSVKECVTRLMLWAVGREGRLAALTEEPSTIRFINKPTEDEQMEAVRKNFNYIKFIKNPLPSVQSYVVNNDPEMIVFIDNPTEEVAMLAKLME